MLIENNCHCDFLLICILFKIEDNIKVYHFQRHYEITVGSGQLV
jgi:hypothetical protein